MTVGWWLGNLGAGMGLGVIRIRVYASNRRCVNLLGNSGDGKYYR